jgi:nucleoside 2-deoxyribosyltransferase
MKAYLAIKYHPDNANRPRIEGISAALETCGFETVCIVRDVERWGQVQLDPADLMDRSFAELETCDVVVVDISEKGVGVGIEAGYAYARRIPILTIAAYRSPEGTQGGGSLGEGADVPETLRGISREVFRYRQLGELVEFFKQVM